MINTLTAQCYTSDKMDAVLKKLREAQPTKVPTRANCNAIDVLHEVREMNKNNLEFYEALFGEISKLREDCANFDIERINTLANDLEQHKTESNEKSTDLENRIVILEEVNESLKKENERLAEKTLEFECRSRKLNLIIGNINEKPGLNSKETYDEIHAKVTGMFRDKLGINEAERLLFRNIGT